MTPPAPPLADGEPPIVMVASSVYGFESDLDQIVATLRAYGYTVWNSHAGTMPTHPGKGNRDICLDAVRGCHVFLGVIRQSYGSGVVGEIAITHEEMQLAIDLDKTRWVLAHQNVFLARQLLRPFLSHFAPAEPPPPPPLPVDNRRWWQWRFRPPLLPPPPRPPLPSLKNNKVLDDLRILDQFDLMARAEVPLDERLGHWVQQYRNVGDILEYVAANLRDIERVRAMVRGGQP